MDNQQAKVDNIIWLAGFADGESCFDFASAFQDKRQYYYPRWRVAGTHFPTLEDIKEILTPLQVGYNISLRTPQKKKHAPSWGVTIQGFKRLEKFLPIISPYLKTKSEQCKRIQAWIQLRKQHEYILSAKQGECLTPYSVQELQLMNEVKKNNHYQLASQTTRFPEEIQMV